MSWYSLFLVSSFNDYGPFNYETVVDRLEHSAIIRYAVSFGASSSDGDEEIPTWTKRLYQKMRSVLLDDLEFEDRLPVLSHLDFGGNNVIVKLVRDKEGKISDITEVVLIDWEFMCWMPAWFEAAQLREFERSLEETYRCVGRTCLRVIGHVSIVPVILLAYCSEESLYTFM
jgi:thiamine kinase-like enzyme